MTLSDNMRGALLMALSMTAFVVNDSFMRIVLEGLPFYQSIFIRGCFITVGLLIMAVWRGQLRYRPGRHDSGLIAIRTFAEAFGTLLFLTALMWMEFANLSAILQALPLSVTLAAALFFGEPIGWRRMGAIAVGFIGVLMIVQPATDAFNIYAVFGVVTVLIVTARDLAARRLSPDAPSVFVALIASVGVTTFGAIGALSESWVQPETVDYLRLLAAALCLMAGYIAAVSAMRVGEISFVAPFRYTSLLVALIIGFLVFDEWPNTLALCGAALVVATGLFTLYRERHSGGNGR